MTSPVRTRNLSIAFALVLAGLGGVARAQDEPRIPISSVPFQIDSPGSYYLTQDLLGANGTTGIRITANHVTLDLMGFSLRGLWGSYSGIEVIKGVQNLTIRNGTVSGWGWSGISAEGVYSSRVENVRVLENVYHGLVLGPGGVILGSVARGNVGIGFWCDSACVVRDSTAVYNHSDGFYVREGGTLTGNTASENQGSGFNLQRNVTISHCVAQGNKRAGIYVAEDAVITSCTLVENANGLLAANRVSIRDSVASRNRSHGIQVRSDSLVTGNNCSDNGAEPAGIGAGILVADGEGNRIDGNTVSSNDTGVWVTSRRNLIVRNSAYRNETNWQILDGNLFGWVLNTVTINNTYNPNSNYNLN